MCLSKTLEQRNTWQQWSRLINLSTFPHGVSSRVNVTFEQIAQIFAKVAKAEACSPYKVRDLKCVSRITTADPFRSA